MKSTSVARQAIMHDVCNAPYVADCPADGCVKCRFNRMKSEEQYVQTCFLPKGEDCKGGECDGCRWYKPNRDKIAELKKVLEEKKLGLDEGRDKYHLVREIGRLADEKHVDKEIVFRMIRENNALRGSRYWYGMGPCSDFFNNELQKYVRDHHSDWRKFTDEFCRQLKEMDKENVQEPNTTNQQTDKEKEMNLEEAMKNPDKLAGQAAEGAYDALLHVAEVMTRTYGKRLNDDQRLHAVSAIEAACKAYLDAKACEKVIVNSDNWGPEGDLAVPEEEPQPLDEPLDEPRYSGEAMLKDDIVRSSMYDLSDAKFSVGPVDFAGYIESIDPHEDNIPIWRARAVFTVGGCDVQFWFKFDEKGSAISNSVKAFDREIHDGILSACFGYKPIPEDMGACKGGENE